MKKKINISDRTLNLIKRQHLKPIPKWEFIAKNWSLWSGLILCLILLILGFGLSIFGVVDNIIVPYLWLFIAIIFLLLSYFLFEKTKGAYRFQKWQVIASIAVIGLVIGSAFFKIGLANRLDQQLDRNIPYYRQMVPMKLETWSQPQSGYLSGTITKVIDSDNFELKDFNNKVWSISGQNVLIRGRVTISVGSEIKLIGSKAEGYSFIVEEIRPWVGLGQNMMKEN
ncbi:MAG: hypothetical protein WC503_03140 [Candidatus Shapirobacteria bacterium]